MFTGLLIGALMAAGEKTFSFGGQTYVHRYSKGDLHEFTPKSQSDLKRFVDMLTVNVYRSAKTGEQLANIANVVVENYKKAGGTIVRTNSIPRTSTREAEHFVAVVFHRADFSEAAFARFRVEKGGGGSLVYSRRSYGKTSPQTMQKWLAANGPKVEKEMMALGAWPTK